MLCTLEPILGSGFLFPERGKHMSGPRRLKHANGRKPTPYISQSYLNLFLGRKVNIATSHPIASKSSVLKQTVHYPFIRPSFDIFYLKQIKTYFIPTKIYFLDNI